jgi:predicted CoA-substrate-specific enzyme activase
VIAAGCDVGSLTAEAVILKDGRICASKIIGVRALAALSAQQVMEEALNEAKLCFKDIDLCFSTGYGRYSIDFAKKNISEISCHGLGAFTVNPEIRTVVDIGGQDCKVISIDDAGMVSDFAMNDKCAAGTGRCLEILAKALGVELDQLGRLSQKAKRGVSITNKCSIFMEMEVLYHSYAGKKIPDIAFGINQAVAKRVASLARGIKIREKAAITGGVSKNPGVVSELEKLLGIKFTPLTVDPQIVGALGAAVFAHNELLGAQGRQQLAAG